MFLGSKYVRRAVPTIYAALFAYFTASKGIPGFRHDWSWPTTSVQWVSTWISSTSGWVPDGYGAPHPYPTQYLITSVLLPIALLLGSSATLVLFSFAIGYSVTSAAGAIVGGGGIERSAAGALALFNPWVYTKLVSGHLVMIASYGACLALAALLFNRRTEWPLLWLSAAAICVQIQFALIALFIAMICATNRAARKIVAAVVVFLMPSLVGIAANLRELGAVPYLIAWQHSQSVNPISALALNGYFTHYTDVLPAWFFWLSFILPALALAGLLLGRRSANAVATALGTLVILVFAMGDRGPFGHSYDRFVVGVHVSGVFRELYDLLAIVAVGYIVLLRRVLDIRPIAVTAAIAGVSMLIAWFLSPPSQFWLNISHREITTTAAPANTRYALLPYQQPLRFNNLASGSDPDLTYYWRTNVSPLNAYSPTYPVTAALSEYEQYGSARDLEALSVSYVYNRAALSSDAAALKEQSVQGSTSKSRIHPQIQRISAMPELSLAPEPKTVSGVPGMGEDAIFFADREPASFHPVTVTPTSADASAGWIEARFAFAAHPEAGQPFGGVFTTSDIPLTVNGPQALVWVKGRLFVGANARARILTSSTRGYRWLPLGGSAMLRCEGECAIAATGAPPRNLPAHAHSRERTALDFHAVLPWLITTTIPAGPKGAVIYNARFNRNWTMFAKGYAYEHVRIAGIANGWLVSARPIAIRAIIVNTAAFVQALCELAGALMVLYAGGVLLVGKGIMRLREIQRQS